MTDHSIMVSDRETKPTDDGDWLNNAGLLVIGRLIVALFGWTGTIIIARNLDSETFGRFTFVFGLLGMMTIVTDLGLGRIALSGVMSDALSDSEDRRSFAGNYIILRSLLGLVGYAAALLFTIVAGYSSDIVTATAIGGLVVIVATASHAYELILQAHLRMGVVAASAVIGRIAQLGLITMAVVADGGLLLLIVPAIVAELVIATIKIPRAVRLQPMTYRARPSLWWPLLREAVPISIGTALATLFFRVDSIMLSKLADFTAVAIYGVAFKFVDLLHFVALSISAPVLTVLVRSWPDDPTTFRRTVERTVGIFAVLSGGLIVHFSLFAPETIELLYGSTYKSGATALQLLVAGEIIAFGSVVGLLILTATARHRPYPYIALAGLVVNVGLNLWAIERWGFEGAAVTTVVTETLVVLGMWFLVRRLAGPDSPSNAPWSVGASSLLRVLPAAALGLGAGAALDAVLPWFVAAVIAAGLYASACFFLYRTLYRTPPGAPTSYRTPPGTSTSYTTPTSYGSERSEFGDAEDGVPSGPIVVVGHSTSGSGAEHVLLRYVDSMLARGWSVRAACPEGFLSEQLRTRGMEPWIIPDLQLPPGPKPVATVTMAARWVRAAAIIRGRSAEDPRSASMVFVVNGLLALPAVRLAGRSRAALWLVHDVVVRRDLRLVVKLAGGGLAGAVGVSQAAAAFPSESGIPTSVVWNGTAWPVDPARLEIVGRPVIGINAMVTPWKGHDVLLEAMAELPGADLEILGGRFPKDAEYLKQLKARAEEPDLAGRVRFLGHRDDPLAAMRGWAVSVSASVEPEAGPLAVLEAMSLGIPVVATSHGGAVEVVGSSGILVTPGDPQAMAAALKRLITEPSLRRTCSISGRAAIAGGLTEEASSRSFLGMIQELAAVRESQGGSGR